MRAAAIVAGYDPTKKEGGPHWPALECPRGRLTGLPLHVGAEADDPALQHAVRLQVAAVGVGNLFRLACADQVDVESVEDFQSRLEADLSEPEILRHLQVELNDALGADPTRWEQVGDGRARRTGDQVG